MNIADAKVKEQESSPKSKLRPKAGEPYWFAAILNWIGWVGIIVTIITGVSIASSGNFGNIPAIFLIVGVSSSLIVIGFSEVIRLLHGIYINTKKS